jgi:hypothetical protein
MDEKKETAVLGIRLPVDDIERFKALVKRLPFATQGSVARDAFQRGVESIERSLKSKKKGPRRG